MTLSLQECHKQLASEMREKVEAVKTEEDTLRSQVDGELSQLIKNALSTLDPVSNCFVILFC